MAGPLRGDHADVHACRWVDPTEVDVEAVGEHEQAAGLQVRRNLRVVDGLLCGVGHEDHDDVRLADGVGDVCDLEARLRGEGARLRARREPDDDPDARLVQVEGMGVALAAVADDRHGLPGERRRIRIVVVVHPRRHRLVASCMDPEPRDMTTAPVRTSSLMPNPRSSATSESTSASVPVASTMTASAEMSAIRPR